MILGSTVGALLPAVILAALPLAASASPRRPAVPHQRPTSAEPENRIAFREATAEAGLGWSSNYGELVHKKTILEMMGPGVGLVDVDVDGDLDAYLLTGKASEAARTRSAVRSSRQAGPGPTEVLTANLLLRNDGRGYFAPAPSWNGAAVSGWSFGVAAADYDNDGFIDLYVTTYGPNHLLRNNGDGSFTDVTVTAGASFGGWSTGAAWADLEGDGWVDLFVTNYVEIDPENPPGSCSWKGVAVPCGPLGLVGGGSVLLRNRGDGEFAIEPLDLGGETHYGLGAVFGDFDDDGDADLYVADDQTPNRLYRNNGGQLIDIALPSGVAYDEDGRTEAGMGTDWGDYDGDGRLDLFVTNFADESNTLYRNLGGELFLDATMAAALGLPSLRYLAWGTAFEDLDSDGDRDLFVANGHVYPDALHDLADRYPQRNQLFLNESGTYRLYQPAPGDGLEFAHVSRGTAFGDVDADGDLDILVGNLDAAPQLLLNELPQGKWLRVRVRGHRANRAGIGARVIVRAGGLELVAEVKGGHSYLSQSAFDLHFGLGDATVAQVTVRWPGDTPPTTISDAPAGALLLVDEAAGVRIVEGGQPP